ncbi:MAG: T9SS type A sorting domain-containing protein, partial [Chitinophagaceae bacterium]
PATTNHLFIRTKNAAGHWSIANEKTFVVAITNDPAYVTAAGAPQNIIAAEYFINTDPGPGNGTAIAVTAATNISDLNTIINTSTLQPSTTNQLFIRTKNAEGHWSIANAKQFVVSITNDPAYSNAAPASLNIVQAEYFIDTDPGVGNATPVGITASGEISNAAATIHTSTLGNGQHHLFLRTKNAEGYWSISNVKMFITGTVVPLHLISFEASNKLKMVSLLWKTENEINTSSFSVERSEDGIHFYSIGSKAAYNTSGTHHYQFDDTQPLNGVSFYRLKQIDIDLSFSYSDILPIARTGADKGFAVSPNPAIDIISVVFTASNRQRNLRLLHSNGTLLKTIMVPAGSKNIQLNVAGYAKGIYMLSLEDGAIRTVQKLMKQ